MSTLNSNKMIINQTEGHSALMGIRLTFSISEVKSPAEAVIFIQDKYFDDQLSNGFFRLLPESHKSLASIDYIHETTEISSVITDASFAANELTSTVEILLCQRDYENGIAEELGCTQKELDGFVENGFALKWEQFSLNCD